VAWVQHGTTMRASPSGRALAAVSPRTAFGSPQFLLVRRRSRGWLGVVSPDAGNRRLGWIPQASSLLVRQRWELRVSLSAHRLTVSDQGSVIARFTVAIGAPRTPTPTGQFSV